MGKKKILWKDGDVFVISLENGTFTVCQVLDAPRPNIVRIAMFNERVDNIDSFDILSSCQTHNLISLVQCTREQLDYNVWRVLGNKLSRPISSDKYPNEQCRKNNWIGSKTYDAALIEDFAKAFYGLIYWDDFFDPNYLDQFLIDLSKKPTNLLLKK